MKSETKEKQGEEEYRYVFRGEQILTGDETEFTQREDLRRFSVQQVRRQFRRIPLELEDVAERLLFSDSGCVGAASGRRIDAAGSPENVAARFWILPADKHAARPNSTK